MSKLQTWQRILLITLVVAVLVGLDQALKIYIRTHFVLGESKVITSWFWICFVENNGMAFGMEVFSKIALTLFRIVAVVFLIGYIAYLFKLERQGIVIKRGYIAGVVFILAGALGNIVDSVFYGVVWAYAPLFYGKVVDMFYFPLIHNSSGEVIFFQPVFNLADSFITCAVAVILLFYREEMNRSLSS